MHKNAVGRAARAAVRAPHRTHSETSTFVQDDAFHRVSGRNFLSRKYNTVAGSRGLGTLTGGTHEHKTVETVYLA